MFAADEMYEIFRSSWGVLTAPWWLMAVVAVIPVLALIGLVVRELCLAAREGDDVFAAQQSNPRRVGRYVP